MGRPKGATEPKSKAQVEAEKKAKSRELAAIWSRGTAAFMQDDEGRTERKLAQDAKDRAAREARAKEKQDRKDAKDKEKKDKKDKKDKKAKKETPTVGTARPGGDGESVQAAFEAAARLAGDASADRAPDLLEDQPRKVQRTEARGPPSAAAKPRVPAAAPAFPVFRI